MTDSGPNSSLSGALPPGSPPTTPRLVVDDATIGYDCRGTQNLDSVEDGTFTAIIGPNGCGKSTLLRALGPRAHAPRREASSWTGGRSATTGPRSPRAGWACSRESLAPDGIRVADLVSRGRAPYQTLFQQWRTSDEVAVAAALRATALEDLSGRLVDELSGGQRQRAWIAMLLAQDTSIMLLDEPTTFLDIAYQYDVMELLRSLHHDGKTIVTGPPRPGSGIRAMPTGSSS